MIEKVVEVGEVCVDGEGKGSLIDVRSPSEFESCHPVGAANLPLDRLNPTEFMKTLDGRSDGTVYLICKSGTRARMAQGQFEKAGFFNTAVVEGGLSAWKKAGLAVIEGKKSMSIDRQARIVIGGLVVLGSLIGWFVDPSGFVLSACVGAGLIFAGITDTCAIAVLLSKMPWNQGSSAITCCTAPFSGEK